MFQLSQESAGDTAMFVIGQRGAPSLAPENAIPFFIKAIELGVDYIEFDMRASRDEVLVVIHDDRVDRLPIH